MTRIASSGPFATRLLYRLFLILSSGGAAYRSLILSRPEGPYRRTHLNRVGASNQNGRALAGGTIGVQVVNEFTAVLRRKFRLEWQEIADAAS